MRRWRALQLVPALVAVLALVSADGEAVASQPHIIFIFADDLGYNDVSWNNPDILSPNLEALAREGVILEQNYAQPFCTPSRAALLSGRYPFHLGRQHSVLSPHMPTGLTINTTLLPAFLSSAGYRSHMVGKWHLGNCAPEYLPQGRGFDSFLGFWAGNLDHYKHTVQDALDFFEDLRPLKEMDGVYSTDVFTGRAERIISEHDAEQPLFLYLAYQNPHTPLQVPAEYEERYPNITNADRRAYSAMVSALDDSVGRVVTALKDANLYNNSVIIFVSDNGGQIFANGGVSRAGCGGSNYPLRGDKGTLWEGATRTPAFVHSPLLERPGRVSDALVHVTDWLPTLLRLAGADSGDAPLDGFDQWDALSAGVEGPRTEMVYNIDELQPAAALRIGEMKLVWGDNSYLSGWYPVLETADTTPRPKWTPPPPWVPVNLRDYPAFLFNLTADPTEHEDLSALMPDTVQAMQERLLELMEELVPADMPDPVDAGDPVDGVWTTGWCEPY